MSDEKIPDDFTICGKDFRYVHTDGRERYGVTPPHPADGWTKQTCDVYRGPWRDDPSPWPRRVKPDFMLEAL